MESLLPENLALLRGRHHWASLGATGDAAGPGVRRLRAEFWPYPASCVLGRVGQCLSHRQCGRMRQGAEARYPAGALAQVGNQHMTTSIVSEQSVLQDEVKSGAAGTELRTGHPREDVSVSITAGNSPGQARAVRASGSRV